MAAVHSKVVVPLLLVSCLVGVLLVVGFCVTLCFVVHYFVYFCNHLGEEERVGLFDFIVLRMSCYLKCSVNLPHSARVVRDCGIS